MGSQASGPPSRSEIAPPMTRSTAACLLPALLLGLAASCASPKGAPMSVQAPDINATLSGDAATVVVPGDQLGLKALSLIALEQRELDVQVLVQPDGSVIVPGLGAVDVAGRTPAQLTEQLEESLAGDLASGSKVSVNIVAPAPRTIHVIGAVKSSGQLTLPIDGHMTLVEALSEAGGVGHYTAYLGNTMLIRWDPEEQRQVSWVVDARKRWWGEAQTILLQPNDIVYVPDTPVARVNSWIDHFIIRNIPFPRFIIPGA